MNRALTNSPAAKIVGLLIFAGAIAAWALYPRRIPPPDEANRVYHSEDGYSIIAPPGWKMTCETASNTMTATDRGWLRVDPVTQGYYPPSIVVHVRNPAPDPDKLKANEGFKDGTYHGHPALVKAFRQHKVWAYAIVYLDRDKWFDICITTPDYYDFPDSMWWPYLDSLKYEPERAKKVATSAPTMDLPTTVPTDLLK